MSKLCPGARTFARNFLAPLGPSLYNFRDGMLLSARVWPRAHKDSFGPTQIDVMKHHFASTWAKRFDEALGNVVRLLLRLEFADSSWNRARTLGLSSCVAFQLSTVRERSSRRVCICRSSFVAMFVKSKVVDEMAICRGSCMI